MTPEKTHQLPWACTPVTEFVVSFRFPWDISALHEDRSHLIGDEYALDAIRAV